MDVTGGGASPGCPVDDVHGCVDTAGAASFLRAECSWLRRGLRLGQDPLARRMVLYRHEACHEAWIGLISAVARCMGQELAGELTGVYAEHGLVAGVLERGAHDLLAPAVADRVLDLRGRRLEALTEEAIARLAASAEPPRAGRVPRTRRCLQG